MNRKQKRFIFIGASFYGGIVAADILDWLGLPYRSWQGLLLCIVYAHVIYYVAYMTDTWDRLDLAEMFDGRHKLKNKESAP